MKLLDLTYNGQPRKEHRSARKTNIRHGPLKMPPVESVLFWLNHDPMFSLEITRRRRKLKRGRRAGHKFGWSLKQFERLERKANGEAKRIVAHMKEKQIFVADNDIAEEAIKETIAILRNPASAKDKLAAAKTLLEYTQKKPATNAELTLNKAEDFLEAVLEDEKASK